MIIKLQGQLPGVEGCDKLMADQMLQLQVRALYRAPIYLVRLKQRTRSCGLRDAGALFTRDTQVGKESSLLSCQAGMPVREFKSPSLVQIIDSPE